MLGQISRVGSSNSDKAFVQDRSFVEHINAMQRDWTATLYSDYNVRVGGGGKVCPVPTATHIALQGYTLGDMQRRAGYGAGDIAIPKMQVCVGVFVCGCHNSEQTSLPTYS